MVLPLIAGLVGCLFIGSLILAFLSYEEIMNWFYDYLDTLHTSKNNLAFTIKDDLENGNYQIVQGIFNQRTGNIIEDRVIEAEEIDDVVLEIHEEYEDEDRTVVYEI